MITPWLSEQGTYQSIHCILGDVARTGILVGGGVPGKPTKWSPSCCPSQPAPTRRPAAPSPGRSIAPCASLPPARTVGDLVPATRWAGLAPGKAMGVRGLRVKLSLSLSLALSRPLYISLAAFRSVGMYVCLLIHVHSPGTARDQELCRFTAIS